MKGAKILLGLALIAIFCVTFGHSLKCFYCTNKKDCERPKSYECTAALANETRTYLDLYHKNTPMNNTSPTLECFREDIKSGKNEYHYRSCIYSNIRGCDLPLRDSLLQVTHDRKCGQCSNKNGCNPAGRADINLSTVFAPTIIVALIAKYVWGN